MKPVDAALLERIDRYVETLFAPPDPVLDANLTAAAAAGLPPIHVSAAEGKLLYLIARMVGARRALEVGTLGGYSTTWLARALPVGGRLVTLEIDERHAAVARGSLRDAAPGVEIDVLVGDAADTLRALIDGGAEPFDLVFIDADKTRYGEYLELVLRLAHAGTVILADNVIRHGLVLDPASGDPAAQGARAYNAAIAANPRLESIVLPIVRDQIDGLALSWVR